MLNSGRESLSQIEYDPSQIGRMGISELVAASMTSDDPQYRDAILNRLKWCGFDNNFFEKLYKLESAIIRIHLTKMPDRLLCEHWWWLRRMNSLPLDEGKEIFVKPHESYTMKNLSEDTLTISEMLSLLDEADYIRTTFEKVKILPPKILNEINELKGHPGKSWLKYEVFIRMMICGASPDTQQEEMEELYKQEILLLVKNKYDYIANSWEPYAGMNILEEFKRKALEELALISPRLISPRLKADGYASLEEQLRDVTDVEKLHIAKFIGSSSFFDREYLKDESHSMRVKLADSESIPHICGLCLMGAYNNIRQTSESLRYTIVDYALPGADTEPIRRILSCLSQYYDWVNIELYRKDVDINELNQAIEAGSPKTHFVDAFELIFGLKKVPLDQPFVL